MQLRSPPPLVVVVRHWIPGVMVLAEVAASARLSRTSHAPTFRGASEAARSASSETWALGATGSITVRFC